MDPAPLSALEERIGHRFRNRAVLEEALRHSSYVNEQADPDLSHNERFEFLGDAVVNLVAAHLLMERFPDLPEGELSRRRARLVNEKQLAEFAREIDLGRFLRLGRGEEQSGGRIKRSILANGFEALSAALYLDAGFGTAFEILSTRFAGALDAVGETGPFRDFKSRLQEWVQARDRIPPRYEVLEESGPDHRKTFWVRVEAEGLREVGVGGSKKAAQQDAARKLLAALEPAAPGPK